MADECPALAHWHTWYMYRWHLTALSRCRYSHGMPNTHVIASADTVANTPTLTLPLPHSRILAPGYPRRSYADGSLRSPIDYWIDLADYHSQCETDLEWIRR
jgi:hypothetical protein